MIIHNRLIPLGVLSVALATPQLVSAQSPAPQIGAARARENARRSSCQSNLKQISLGVMQYMQDHKEKLPPAKNWIEAVMPYVRDEALFKCPSVIAPKRFGYAYNSNLSKKYFADVVAPWATAMVYETTVLRRSVSGKGENRAYRHMDGANFAYADGHIKWVRKTAAVPSFKLKP